MNLINVYLHHSKIERSQSGSQSVKELYKIICIGQGHCTVRLNKGTLTRDFMHKVK